MPKVHVERSIIVRDKIGEVYSVLNDFHSWVKWSPWLITEPGAKVDIRTDGKYYEWNGEVVGTGNMTVIEEEINKNISYDLTFLTPYKSKASVGFHLRSTGEEETEVTWSMDSKLPFFLFFMKRRMESMIGMDYERGLKMLKEYIEEGLIKSRIEIKGYTQVPAYNYIGIRSVSSISRMGEKHKADFTQLMDFVRENGIEMSGVPGTIYQKWEPHNDSVEYIALAPVDKVPSSLPTEFITGESEGFKGYSVEHIGAYHHLGNAWSAGFSRQYNKVFKGDRKNFPLELYHNSPVDTPQEELRTEIVFPAK